VIGKGGVGKAGRGTPLDLLVGGSLVLVDKPELLAEAGEAFSLAEEEVATWGQGLGKTTVVPESDPGLFGNQLLKQPELPVAECRRRKATKRGRDLGSGRPLVPPYRFAKVMPGGFLGQVLGSGEPRGACLPAVSPLGETND